MSHNDLVLSHNVLAKRVPQRKKYVVDRFVMSPDVIGLLGAHLVAQKLLTLRISLSRFAYSKRKNKAKKSGSVVSENCYS